MLLNVLRALFLLLVAVLTVKVAESILQVFPYPMVILGIGLVLAAAFIAIDIFIPQKSLLAISAVFFGLLVGLLVSYVASLVLDLFVAAYGEKMEDYLLLGPEQLKELVSVVKVLIGVVFCYMAVSFILQTKDDVRFVIPYVEFAKERKGSHPLILDTSVIIDGRIVEILGTWRLDTPVVIPRFVLHELQTVADSGDKLKRNRGRRGLDIVNKLQANQKLEVKFEDTRMTREEEAEPVDQRLVTLARKIDGRIVTNDYNLNKVAQIRGVEVININELANALKPVFLPGESMTVKIIKPGEEAGQGVGYLEDGTMVVVEGGRERIGETIPIMVTSVLQTSAGRMVFGRSDGTPGAVERPGSRRRGSGAPT
jgi:uncharacterized protein YacL